MPDEFATQVTSVAALAEPVRRELYQYVSAQPEPVSRDQAGEAAGIPRHTAKFHLDKLVDEGLLDVEFRRLGGRRGPGAGRPTKLYRRSAREVAVTLPQRQYDVAGQLMAEAIEQSVAQGVPPVEALTEVAARRGRQLGERAREVAGPRPGRARLVEAICTTLAGSGYEPRLDGPLVTLANCPFHALAAEHTDLVCGMNLALVGALAESTGSTLSARLDPAPDRCCVVLGG